MMFALFAVSALMCYGNVVIQIRDHQPGYRQRAVLFLVAGWVLTLCAWLV